MLPQTAVEAETEADTEQIFDKIVNGIKFVGSYIIYPFQYMWSGAKNMAWNGLLYLKDLGWSGVDGIRRALVMTKDGVLYIISHGTNGVVYGIERVHETTTDVFKGLGDGAAQAVDNTPPDL